MSQLYMPQGREGKGGTGRGTGGGARGKAKGEGKRREGMEGTLHK